MIQLLRLIATMLSCLLKKFYLNSSQHHRVMVNGSVYLVDLQYTKFNTTSTAFLPSLSIIKNNGGCAGLPCKFYDILAQMLGSWECVRNFQVK